MSQTVSIPYTRCPLCQAELRAVKLVDKAAEGSHADLEYTANDAKKSVWTSSFPIAGAVVALMCQGCGHILLFGVDYARIEQSLKQRKKEGTGRVSLAPDEGSGALSEPEDQ